MPTLQSSSDEATPCFTNNKHKVQKKLYLNKMRNKDLCISTVLIAASYSHCWPVDIYTSFIYQTVIKLLTYTPVLFTRLMIKLLTYAPVSDDRTDDESIDVYTSFVYQTDD